ncbi:MAG: LPS export ABC transporter periplasmic protein LptC [Bacteroidales bacterium]|nr:LPS export ABC transporter periplasmic protein LptC [Bacteroidales bacterium]
MAVAFVVFGCGGKLKEADKINLAETPIQVVNDMFAVNTEDGVVKQRFESAVMLKYVTDTLDYDVFPNGLQVYGYTEEGLLETIIMADKAKHVASGKHSQGEKWEATGNVVVSNVIKKETMETDTLYWDRKNEQIYTDAYVKLYSEDGMMQGYGMRSDDRARNAILLRPFDSYGYSQSDSTTVKIDSVNFIGPLLK